MTPGLRFGRYEVGDRLGKGGFGVVHVARDSELGRDVAIKFLKPEYLTRESIVQRFLQEARAAAKIVHPGIVTVFECGVVSGTGQRIDGTAYIVMERLQGTSLSERTGKPLPIERVVAIGRQLATALAAAHAAGIIHRDLKPDNVFLVPDAAVVGGERAKILDFGIAKLADPGPGGVHTHSQMILGTPRYMSPEQARSAAKVDTRSDIYSLGCMLYELTCGRSPFDGGDAGDIIIQHQTADVTPPRDLMEGVPEPLDRLIVAMLAKKPEDRPATMQAIDTALAAISAPSPEALPSPVPRLLPATKPPRAGSNTTLIEPPPGPPPAPRADGDQLAIDRPRPGGDGAREAAGMIARGTIEESTLTDNTLDTKRGISRVTVAFIGGCIVVFAMILFLVCGRSGSRAVAVDAALIPDAPPVPIVTVPPDAASDAPVDRLAIEVRCKELAVDRNWTELAACGKSLMAVGGDGMAYLAKSRLEATAEIDLRSLVTALAAGDIKESARLLAAIPATSVYAREALRTYNDTVNKLVRAALAELGPIARAGNCSQVSTRIAELEQQYGKAFAEDVRADLPKCGEARGEVKPDKGKTVPKPRDETEAALDCSDSKKVSEIEAHAEELLMQGSFLAALTAFDRALACKPSLITKTYLAACRAKQFARAKKYFRSLSNQPAMAQICMKEGFDPR